MKTQRYSAETEAFLISVAFGHSGLLSLVALRDFSRLFQTESLLVGYSFKFKSIYSSSFYSLSLATRIVSWQ